MQICNLLRCCKIPNVRSASAQYKQMIMGKAGHAMTVDEKTTDPAITKANPGPVGNSANRFLQALTRKRFQRVGMPVIGLVIALLAFFILGRLLQNIAFDDVLAAITQIPGTSILLALIFTTISFAAVAAYDVVAVDTIAPGKIPRRISLMAGAAGYAISNALGFSLVTGGALRYRVYAAEGINLADIGRIIGTSWFAIWFAFAIMIAIAMVADPTGVPWLSSVHPAVDVTAGLAVLGAIAALVIWLSRGERTLSLGRMSVRLPSSNGALVQIGAGLVDVAAAAATLYVLLPSGSVSSFAVFVLVYVVAVMLGIISHSPGGVGAFEATVIAGLGLGQNPDAIAALVAYRVIYTVLPFLVAVAALVVSEVLRRRERLSAPAKAVARVMEPLIPPLSAGIAFLGAIILLISSLTPDLSNRVDVLANYLPLPILELSHLAASFVAVALLIVARGLAKRLRRAWVVGLVLFSSGAVFALAKGLDWEEALILSMLAAVLWLFRDSFYRRPLDRGLQLSWGWLASVSAIVFGSIFLGLFAFNDIEYSHDLWWEFAFDSDAPRFMRAAVLIGTVLLAALIHTLINQRGGRKSGYQAIPTEVPHIVAQARNTTAALALLGDKRFLMSTDGRGFVMYARSGGSLIAMGEPVGPEEQIGELAWAFHDLADRTGARTVFYEVGTEHLPLFLDMGLVALKLGEIARVDLTTFTLDGAKRQPLRYADRRADKEELVFEIVPKDRVLSIIPELEAVSDAWLAMKSGSEKRFSLGFFDPAFLAHFDMAVMRHQGEIVAFANLWRSGDRHEIAVDLMRHRPDASKIIMDALFTKIMVYAKGEGYHWFNLGAAPLSGLVNSRLASRWNRFGSFLYRRGRDFYHFDGLRSFKEKFGPVWTPHYLICPPGLDTPRSLLDVTTLVSGHPLELVRK